MTRTDLLKLLLGDDLCCEYGGYWRERPNVYFLAVNGVDGDRLEITVG